MRIKVAVLLLTVVVGSQGVVPTFVVAGMPAPDAADAADALAEYLCEDFGGVVGDVGFGYEGEGEWHVIAECANGGSGGVQVMGWFHCPSCIEM